MVIQSSWSYSIGPCPEKGSLLGLMLFCCHPEILNTFWTRSFVFSFVAGPCELHGLSCLNVIIYTVHYIENLWAP